MISSEKKTPKSIDSRMRNAILYFLMLFSAEKFQDSSIQIGIKKAVSSTNNRLKPSAPNNRRVPENGIQVNSSHSWNCPNFRSKNIKSNTAKLNTNSDHINEKFLIKYLAELGMNVRMTDPKMGSAMKSSNIN